MATRYIIDCANSTDKSYYFCVYQTFPRSPGLRSVAWQVRGIPPKGQAPSTADVEWDMVYGVSILNWHKYTGEQIVTAQLGKTYEVVMIEGTIPAINPIPILSTETDSGLIGFKNNTNKPLDMGFTIDGSLIAVQNVCGGETIFFDVHPTYYVACYRSLQKGQLVDSVVALSPVEVKYEDGYTYCEVEAAISNGTYTV